MSPQRYQTHQWGDESFNWRRLDEAINFISQYCRRWGRIGISAKEKWGNADIYPQWLYQFHCLFYPGYHRSQFPKWLWSLDCTLGVAFLENTGLKWAIHTYQHFIYQRAYKLALAKYPDLKWEILGGTASYELLRAVMIQEGMEKPYKTQDCWDGLHEFSRDNYCDECYARSEQETGD